jgi:hypothetical protein
MMRYHTLLSHVKITHERVHFRAIDILSCKCSLTYFENLAQVVGFQLRPVPKIYNKSENNSGHFFPFVDSLQAPPKNSQRRYRV